MNKEMICKNCKYHYIEELTFDYPQSCCRKRGETTEQWCKCNDFEYGDRYIEQLQQKVNQLETNIDEAINHLKNDDNIIDTFFKHDFRKQNNYNPLTGEDYCPVRCVELYGYDELLEKLERGKE